MSTAIAVRIAVGAPGGVSRSLDPEEITHNCARACRPAEDHVKSLLNTAFLARSLEAAKFVKSYPMAMAS